MHKKRKMTWIFVCFFFWVLKIKIRLIKSLVILLSLEHFCHQYSGRMRREWKWKQWEFFSSCRYLRFLPCEKKYDSSTWWNDGRKKYEWYGRYVWTKLRHSNGMIMHICVFLINSFKVEHDRLIISYTHMVIVTCRTAA